jgi:hypothetical protein
MAIRGQDEGERAMSQPNEVEIILTVGSYRCLIEHVSEASPALKALTDATRLHGIVGTPDQFSVTCDPATAQALLAVAERHCKAAVQPVKVAIAEHPKGGSR